MIQTNLMNIAIIPNWKKNKKEKKLANTNTVQVVFRTGAKTYNITDLVQQQSLLLNIFHTKTVCYRWQLFLTPGFVWLIYEALNIQTIQSTCKSFASFVLTSFQISDINLVNIVTLLKPVWVLGCSVWQLSRSIVSSIGQF